MSTPTATDDDESDISKSITPELAESLRKLSVNMNKQLAAHFNGINLMQKQWAEFCATTATIKIPSGFIDGLRLQEKQLTESFRNTFRGVIPSNWPKGALSRIEDIETILEEEGIPIVHIPRSEIVTELMDAATFDDRLTIIDARADDIAEDCKAALSGVLHGSIEKQTPLAIESVETFLAGRYAAAQALAVLVCDTYLKLYLGGEASTKKGGTRNITYPEMAAKVAIDKTMNGPIGLVLNIFYAFAPVASFLVEWWPDKPNQGPPPTTLSRHVSVHSANTEFMTKRNATVAIMLVASLTVAIDKMERWPGNGQSASS